MFTMKKKVPETFEECYQTDAVSNNLWNWAGWLETWGKRLLIFLIIFGVFASIKVAIEFADVDEELAVYNCINSIVQWLLYAFLEYCAYHVLALLISALASIVQNSKISADVALYNAAKQENILKTEENKDANASVVPASAGKKINSGDYWRCKVCGTKNEIHKQYCKDCGTYK